MKRRQFIGIAGGTVLAAGTTAYLLSDKGNLSRSGLKSSEETPDFLKADEKEILSLASLAPSEHNTQPWFVQYVEPFHWIIGNDKNKWLPAVDPNQRETILSIGAFVQNLELGASTLGYQCDWELLAKTNQDERVLEVKLVKKDSTRRFDIEKIKTRRTVRSNFGSDVLRKEDLDLISGGDAEIFQYLPFKSKEAQYLNEQTIEANRLQTYRDPAQKELAGWIRFSSEDAEQFRDGLTTGSMEIEGFAGWLVRNFYDKESVMTKDFREKGLDKVKKQVSRSAGWVLMLSKDDGVESLLETGRRWQGFLLNAREKNIAIHPMTQILEETSTQDELNNSIGMSENIQFIMRTGYVKNYPSPVSLRRPVAWFVRKSFASNELSRSQLGEDNEDLKH